MGIVHDPLVNKGTGFDTAEKDRLRIRGLVPPRTLTMEMQQKKIFETFMSSGSPMDKNLYLSGLQDRNETLFYKVLMDNIELMAPVVYTPVVGQVCQKFGSHFRRTRGMYFSSEDKGNMSAMVRLCRYSCLVSPLNKRLFFLFKRCTTGHMTMWRLLLLLMDHASWVSGTLAPMAWVFR